MSWLEDLSGLEEPSLQTDSSNEAYFKALADVLRNPFGLFILAEILSRCGCGGFVGNQSIQLRNFGERLLSECYHASEKHGIELLKMLRLKNGGFKWQV